MSGPDGGEIVISATAVVSPVGQGADQTCAALRAGVSRFGEHPFFSALPPGWPPSEPEPARVAFVAGPGVGEPLADRLLRLALPAAAELVARGRLQRADLSAAAFLMSLPSTAGGRPRPASAAELQTRYLRRLEITPAVTCDCRESGTSGMIAAVAEAVGRLQRREVRMAIVAGVDSYLDADTMRWLDETGRLRSERNPDGFIPGEAAVLLLLERGEDARGRRAQPLAAIAGAATAQESAPILSERFTTGTGLANAILGATAASPSLGANLWAVADLNGQSYRAQEWGVIQSRLSDRLPPAGRLWHPADCVGDVGAAAGGLQLALVAHSFWRRNAEAPAALVWGAGEGGERAACILQAPGGG